MNIKGHTFTASLPALLLGVSLLLCGTAVSASGVHQAVGRVTFVIGQPSVVGASGQVSAAQRGSPIHAGDTIKTDQGTHVHVRFTDGALVSVRPGSQLVVEEYQYSPSDPKANSIRFKLETGTARAISGAAAESAKERFRLNTPLVAIGVRGTDFVVSSLPDKTTASVNQGAIVMAPFVDGCVSSGLGPCGNSGARTLSADMGHVLAEYSSGLSQPVVKGPVAAPSAPLMAAGPAQGTARSQPGASDGLGSKDGPFPNLLIAANANGSVAEDVLSDLGQATKPNPAPASLAWGRWTANTFAEDFSVTVQEASSGRKVTVGNDRFVLYRTPGSFAETSTGAASFKLDRAAVQYIPTSGAPQSATAENGFLSINFGAKQFSTSLQLHAQATGHHSLVASGQVDAEGLFRSYSVDHAVAGAISFDQNAAGYLFQRVVGAGAFRGTSLWSR